MRIPSGILLRKQKNREGTDTSVFLPCYGSLLSALFHDRSDLPAAIRFFHVELQVRLRIRQRLDVCCHLAEDDLRKIGTDLCGQLILRMVLRVCLQLLFIILQIRVHLVHRIELHRIEIKGIFIDPFQGDLHFGGISCDLGRIDLILLEDRRNDRRSKRARLSVKIVPQAKISQLGIELLIDLRRAQTVVGIFGQERIRRFIVAGFAVGQIGIDSQADVFFLLLAA